ncbi:MAG: glycosyltransferase [Elusimicrobiota bacterium]
MIIIYIFSLSFSFLVLTIFLFHTIKYRESGDFTQIPERDYPKVSILKPVKHLDDELEENLKTFYNLDYPDFEIVFGVDNKNDTAYNMLYGLSKKFPNIPTKIIETGSTTEHNPKIHKLTNLESSCSGDFYWVADANVRVAKYTLKKLVNEYYVHNSKLVFSPIKATGSHSLGSIIENAYINLFVSGGIITAWELFNQQIIVGKSMFIEKKTLDLFGGFSYFKKFVGEDFMVGESYSENKFLISTNFTWVVNYNSKTTIKNFCSRISRWAKIRFSIKPAIYVLEIILNPIVISATSVIFLNIIGLYLFLSSVVLKILLEYISLFAINREDSKKIYIVVLYPFFIFLKDILLFAIYLTPYFSRTIKWKNRKIKITRKSVIRFDKKTN